MSIRKNPFSVVQRVLSGLVIFALTCSHQQDEMVQKSISALPTAQKSGLAEVVFAEPAAGATGVQREAGILLAFGTKVNTTSVQSGFSVTRVSDGTIVAGTFTWQQGTTLTFTPSSLLAYSTDYQLTVNGLTSLGKNLIPYAATFRTGHDGTIPTVIASTPGNGTSEGTTIVSVTWSEAMNVAATNASCTFNGVPCTVGNLTWMGNNVTYTTTAVCGQTNNLAFVNAEDVSGAPVTYTKTFTSAPCSVPTVLSFSPADNVANGLTTLSILWSEAMDTAVASLNCLYDGAACDTGAISWSGNTFNYPVNLSCGQSHTISFTQVQDLFGTTSTYSKTFTTVPCCTNVYPDCCNGASYVTHCLSCEGSGGNTDCGMCGSYQLWVCN